MRDIKFRAWCNDQKRMFKKVLIGNTANPDSDDYTAHCIFRDGDWYHSDEHDNVLFMQYTGLKDKNGVEIYDGDIIHDWGEPLEVKWITDGWFAERELAGICEAGQEWENSCEVIGNIHENTELIK